jgi:chlorophyll/bacteriochlorophyll a synthase
MDRLTATTATSRVPAPFPALRDILELLKPVTWFPPMWAFFCGVVSSGVPVVERWQFLALGILLTGPLVCGTSQAVNDWFDRHVDAINEPGRPIPSGRVGGRWGLWIAILGTMLSLTVSTLLGPWVLIATIFGLILAWAYSAPPLRLKKSGWLGPLTCAFAYEGLTWFTGAAVMLAAFPSSPILLLAGLYALGAFGIMTLNDFKAVEGDRQMGIASLPVTMGVRPAALLACGVMLGAQFVIVALLVFWGLMITAAIISGLVLGQLLAMRRLVRDPAQFAPWYNGAGVSLYVLGMLIAAFGVRGMEGLPL